MELTEVSETISSESIIKMTKTEAKNKIQKLFKQIGNLDYIEIVSNLGLDLKLVVTICEELEKEKKIEGIK